MSFSSLGGKTLQPNLLVFIGSAHTFGPAKRLKTSHESMFHHGFAALGPLGFRDSMRTFSISRALFSMVVHRHFIAFIYVNYQLIRKRRIRNIDQLASKSV